MNLSAARQEARATGASRYFTGKPCKHGHSSERLTSNGHCIKCLRAAETPESKRRFYAIYRARNPDREKNRYASDPEFHKARSRAWRAANPEKVKAAQLPTEEASARMQRWREANRDKARAAWHRRECLHLNAEGSYTPADIAALLKSQDGKCLCGGQFGAYTVDHKIPLSRGGSNWPDNLQLLCAPCNASKGARTMAEWKGRSDAILP